MPITRVAEGLARRMLDAVGLIAIRRSTAEEIAAAHPWLADRLGVTAQEARPARVSEPPGTDGPSANDPRLADLRRRYAGHVAATHRASTLALDRFREDAVSDWHLRGTSPMQYLLSAYYARSNDPLRLFDRLVEDAAFGAPTVEHEGRTVSRDLLDAVLEINFLEEEIGLSRLPQLSVLDIGAGYGRLGHRMAESLPNLERYICADAEAESTFLSGFYATHRGVAAQVKAAPLDEIEALLGRTRVDVALNIHGFSNRPLASIEYWLDLVARAKVPWLFIVPSAGDSLLSRERDDSRRDFQPLVEARGYELAVKRQKYHRSPNVQQFGLLPSTYHLFRRGDMYESGQYAKPRGAS